jgi:hypothetical protein
MGTRRSPRTVASRAARFARSTSRVVWWVAGRRVRTRVWPNCDQHNCAQCPSPELVREHVQLRRRGRGLSLFLTFQYQGKATKAEREAGCEAIPPSEIGVHTTTDAQARGSRCAGSCASLPDARHARARPVHGVWEHRGRVLHRGRPFVGSSKTRAIALARARIEWSRGQAMLREAADAPVRPGGARAAGSLSLTRHSRYSGSRRTRACSFLRVNAGSS